MYNSGSNISPKICCTTHPGMLQLTQEWDPHQHRQVSVRSYRQKFVCSRSLSVNSNDSYFSHAALGQVTVARHESGIAPGSSRWAWYGTSRCIASGRALYCSSWLFSCLKWCGRVARPTKILLFSRKEVWYLFELTVRTAPCKKTRFPLLSLQSAFVALVRRHEWTPTPCSARRVGTVQAVADRLLILLRVTRCWRG